MRQLVFVLLLAVLAGVCGDACALATQFRMSYHIHVAPQFTSDRQQAVIRAAYDWKAAIPELDLRYSVDNECPAVEGDVCVVPASQAVVADMCQDKISIGCTLHFRGDFAYVALQQDFQTDDHLYERLAEHELGHSFGLNHLAKGNIMAPFIEDTPMLPTCLDIQEFWQLRKQPYLCNETDANVVGDSGEEDGD